MESRLLAGLIALSLLDCRLAEEQHAKLHIRGEVDIHGEFKALNSVLINSLAYANRMVIDKDVDWTVLLRNLLEESLCACYVCQVRLIEMGVFEASILGNRFQVIHQ